MEGNSKGREPSGTSEGEKPSSLPTPVFFRPPERLLAKDPKDFTAEERREFKERCRMAAQAVAGARDRSRPGP